MDVQRIRTAMLHEGISQAGLAHDVGCTQGTIQQILSGTTKQSRQLPAIARRLRTTTEYLMGYTNDPTSTDDSNGDMDVHTSCDDDATRQTMGQKLNQMRQRSERTLNQIADDGGWKGTSSVQRYFHESYDTRALHPRIARRMVKALCGHGRRPVEVHEIDALTDGNFVEAQVTERQQAADRSYASDEFIDLSVLAPADRLAMLTLYQSLSQRRSRH